MAKNLIKVLILQQDYDDPGGISKYFKFLRSKFEIQNQHMEVGKRVGEKGILKFVFRLLCDYIRFIKIIRYNDFDLIHINVSLNLKGVLRDGLFLLIGKHLKKNILVFFHGWDLQFEKKLELYGLILFKIVYNGSNAFVVLANRFKSKLVSWGFKQPIYVESTVVEDELLNSFSITSAIYKRTTEPSHKILFLSRIIKEKGVYETVDALDILHQNYPDISLFIAGKGAELERVKKYVDKKNIYNVFFTGYVEGNRKKELFEKAYLFCFPSYSEGLPISLLEAMAFGLPIITTSVGGIKDFFENGKHGFIIDLREPSKIATLIEKLVLEQELYKQISFENYKFAKERFLATQVVKRLEKIYKELLAYNVS